MASLRNRTSKCVALDNTSMISTLNKTDASNRLMQSRPRSCCARPKWSSTHGVLGLASRLRTLTLGNQSNIGGLFMRADFCGTVPPKIGRSSSPCQPLPREGSTVSIMPTAPITCRTRLPACLTFDLSVRDPVFGLCVRVRVCVLLFRQENLVTLQCVASLTVLAHPLLEGRLRQFLLFSLLETTLLRRVQEHPKGPLSSRTPPSTVSQGVRLSCVQTTRSDTHPRVACSYPLTAPTGAVTVRGNPNPDQVLFLSPATPWLDQASENDDLGNEASLCRSCQASAPSRFGTPAAHDLMAHNQHPTFLPLLPLHSCLL